MHYTPHKKTLFIFSFLLLGIGLLKATTNEKNIRDTKLCCLCSFLCCSPSNTKKNEERKQVHTRENSEKNEEYDHEEKGEYREEKDAFEMSEDHDYQKIDTKKPITSSIARTSPKVFYIENIDKLQFAENTNLLNLADGYYYIVLNNTDTTDELLAFHKEKKTRQAYSHTVGESNKPNDRYISFYVEQEKGKGQETKIYTMRVEKNADQEDECYYLYYNEQNKLVLSKQDVTFFCFEKREKNYKNIETSLYLNQENTSFINLISVGYSTIDDIISSNDKHKKEIFKEKKNIFPCILSLYPTKIPPQIITLDRKIQEDDKPIKIEDMLYNTPMSIRSGCHYGLICTTHGAEDTMLAFYKKNKKLTFFKTKTPFTPSQEKKHVDFSFKEIEENTYIIRPKGSPCYYLSFDKNKLQIKDDDILKNAKFQIYLVKEAYKKYLDLDEKLFIANCGHRPQTVVLYQKGAPVHFKNVFNKKKLQTSNSNKTVDQASTLLAHTAWVLCFLGTKTPSTIKLRA